MHSENEDGRVMRKIISERINAASGNNMVGQPNNSNDNGVAFDWEAKVNASQHRPVSYRIRSRQSQLLGATTRHDAPSDNSVIMKIVAERGRRQDDNADEAGEGSSTSVVISTSTGGTSVAPLSGADSGSTSPTTAQEDQQVQPGAYRLAPGQIPFGPNPIPAVMSTRSPKGNPPDATAHPQQGAWASRRRWTSNRSSGQTTEGHRAALDGLATTTSTTTTRIDGTTGERQQPTTCDEENAESTEERATTLGTEDNLSNDERRNQEEKEEHEQKFAYIIYTLATCLGVGALALLGFLIAITIFPSTSSQNDDKIDSDSISPFLTHQEALKSFQESLGLGVGSSQLHMAEYSGNEDVTLTPQAAAFKWVANDPFLANYPLWRIQQRYALILLFHQLWGTPVGHWEESSLVTYNQSECEWTWRRSTNTNADNAIRSTACDASTGVYERLDLDYFPIPINNLPSEIAMLSSLEHLTVSNLPPPSDLKDVPVSLSTFLPTELVKLSRLSVLEVSSSPYLQPGPFPSAIYQLTELKELEISDVQLTGTISTEIERLTELESLLLFDNALSGTIPPTLPNVLQTLWLQGNAMSGSLPYDLPTTLNYLYLDRNQLTGTLPPSWKSLTNLVELRLSFNMLQGTIPVDWGSGMGSLNVLGVKGLPNLRGAIPQGFCIRTPLHRTIFYADCGVLDCCSS